MANIDAAVTLMQQHQYCLWLAEPQGQKNIPPIPDSKGVAIFVGPEGGFTENEIACLQNAGAHSISIGVNILRTEIAALAILAQISQRQV